MEPTENTTPQAEARPREFISHPNDMGAVWEQATAVKKEKGMDEAIRFLFSVPANHTLVEDNFRALLAKLTPYAIKAKEVSIADIIAFYNDICNKATATYKVRCYKELAGLYKRLGRFNDAAATLAVALANISAENITDYYYDGHTLNLEYAEAVLKTDAPAEESAKVFLHHLFKALLIKSAYSIYMNGKANVNSHELKKALPHSSLGNFKPFDLSFIARDITPALAAGSTYCQIMEQLNQALKADAIAAEFVSAITQHYFTALGYKAEFFTPEFTDIIAYGEAFLNDKGEATFATVTTNAMPAADTLAATFTQKIVG